MTPPAQPHTHYHKDGSVWAKGQVVDGAATGYWEWFRKDGSKSRSGWFVNGHPVGAWTTYTSRGVIHKITERKRVDTGVKIPFQSHPNPGGGAAAGNPIISAVPDTGPRCAAPRP